MIHCYIFNYGTFEIYHTTIPDDIDDVDEYISKKFNLRIDEIFSMTGQNTLTIKEL